jgi:hypothetical protein
VKTKKIHIILFLFVMSSFYGFSQEKPIQGYKIDGNYIIFTFDKRQYEVGTNDKNQQRIDFEDFNIKSVVLSGNFNNWSKKKWKMTKIDENIYQLKKKITDFNDDYNWEFKFVVNNSFWAEPKENIVNITPAKTWYGSRLNSFNLRIIPAYIFKNGNAKFFLKGYENAKKVILSGSFNRWDEHLYKMIKTKNGWKLNLQLNPNSYQYRFIVDGNWMEDPSNINRVPNEFDEYNSVINIEKEVTFFLNDFKNAKKVILAGSFNNWSENQFQMKKTENGWIYKTTLTGGKHHYKFIIDGNWKLDPNNSVKEYDGKGNINSVKMVK